MGQIIENILEPITRKGKHSLRSIWNAVMYVIKTDIQWRMLPCNFANWQLVYYYFRKWVNNRSLNSFDGNKKIKGVKCHVLVDKKVFLLAIMLTVAHFHDSKVVM